MAHVWVEDTEGRDWTVWPLHDDAAGLAPSPLARWLGTEDDAELPRAQVARHGEGREEEWILLACPGIARVNGSPLLLGTRVLRDRDEIVLHAGDRTMRCFFSTERLPRPEPFPSDRSGVRCARCKDFIAAGDPAVRCPNCDLWHHQIEGGRKCWTYLSGCASCGHPTQLDGQYRWTPEGL